MQSRHSRERRLWPFCCLLLVCLCLPVSVRAGDMIDVQAPDSVGAGKAFVVRIASWYPLQDLEVHWNGKVVRPQVTLDGKRSEAVVLLGLDFRGETGAYPLEVAARIWGHERRYSRTVEIVESEWRTETLRVAPKMVRPPKEVQARIDRDREALRAALSEITPTRYWSLPLTRPVKGKMLSRFGLYRTFNGDVASRHTGLDFRAWMGTPIHAVAAGKVVLTRALYFGGNTVLIDHGNGFFTMYCHLSETKVQEGAMVKAGQVVGLSGATGRVTGAHLHLAAFILRSAVDPEPFFDGGILSKVNEK